MIVCKPKRSTYFSLGIVVIILIAGLTYLMTDFRTEQTYGLWFYLISSSLLTVMLLLLLVKMMAGYRFLSAGKGKLEVRLPLRALRKVYKLAQVKVWQEEIILANKKEFRQMTVVFDDNTSFSLSNHEHTSYMELLKYFQTKLTKKKVQ